MPGRQFPFKTMVKLAVSVGITAFVLYKVLTGEGMEELSGRIAAVSWPLLAAAMAAQLAAMGMNLVRWRYLLLGQGIEVAWKDLVTTFLIGRFVGSFTPSTSGLDGWRMYDIARQSGSTARAVSSILVEKVIGFFVLAVLVLATLPWGVRYLGPSAIGLVALGVFPLGAIALGVLARPGLVEKVFARLPERFRKKASTTLDAVTTYGKHRRELFLGVLCGFPVHGFTLLIYVLTARSLGIETPTFDLLFVSLMAIAATLLPISIAGVGVREGTFVGLLGLVGVPASSAALTGFLGYLCGEFISLCGGPVLFFRPTDYRMAIKGEGVRSEVEIAAERARALPTPWKTAIQQGLSAGVLAGVCLGLAEAGIVLAQAAPPRDLSVLPFAAVTYGIATACAGVGLAAVLAWWTSRKGETVDAARLWATTGATLFAGLGLVVVRFRVFRDVFHEGLRPMSGKGLAVQLAIAAVFGLVFFAGRRLALGAVRPSLGKVLLRAWGSPAAAGLLAGAFALVSFLASPRGADGARRAARTGADPSAPNVLFVVVDTLRADAIGAYGGPHQTPNLDRLASEGVLFEKAFAQASWTRPSFATILSGRFPSSHRTMFKTDALPEALVTLPEALVGGGYTTAGFVTNYNVAPYFDFDQGFDEYHYLEPELVLGANDTESRLALYSVVRLVWERFGSMKVSRFYRDARETTDAVTGWLDRRDARAPFFLFVGYMDPHDPYFRHPYDGTAVARVTEPNPPPSKAREMRALYDGEVRYWDHHFGRLLAKLRSMPGKDGRSLLDDTMIVVTADHGEEFAEHGGFWHGTTLYDEAVHVPLVVRLPRNGNFPTDAGVRSPDWVRHVDLAPTILGACGVEAASGMQGRSFLEASDTPRREPVFAEEDHEGNRLVSVRVFEDGVEKKLILANEGNPRGLAPEELYAIGRDPGELRNVASGSGGDVRRLTGTIHELARGAAQGAVQQSGLSLDEGSEDRLRSLGYAGAGGRPPADAGPDAR